MKEDIRNLLINNGIDKKIFVVHQTGDTKGNKFKNSFQNISKEVKYKILCINNHDIILVWDAFKSPTICSVYKTDVFNAVKKKLSHIYTIDQYYGWGEIKICVSNSRDIVRLIKELEK